VLDTLFALLILTLLFGGIASIFALRWRLVLQEEERVSFPPVIWDNEIFLSELGLFVRLLRRSGQGAGERHRRASRAFYILAGLTILALFLVGVAALA
jgi:hypothetical protein